MNIVAINSNPPVTLTHIKGNAFDADFEFHGAAVISNVVGRVTRMDDMDEDVLVEFSSTDGSATVNGAKIILSKDDSDILVPRGVYAFELEATIDGVRDKVFKNSFFIVE